MFALPTTVDAVAALVNSGLTDEMLPELAPIIERFQIETGTTAASDGCGLSPTNPWVLGHRDLSEAFATWCATQEAAAAPLVLSLEDEPMDRTAAGRAIATMRRRVAEIEASNTRLQRARDEAWDALRTERSARRTFDDSHPDWSGFWTRAAMAANEAGHCPEYDTIAEAMGGVPRSEMTRTVTVEVTLRTEVDVPMAFRVRYNEDATEAGMDAIRSALESALEDIDSSDVTLTED